MKKFIKKIIAMVFVITILCSTSMTALASSCPPHNVYPMFEDILSTEYTTRTHVYDFYTGLDIYGNPMYENRTCYYYDAQDTNLFRLVCSICGQTVGTYTDLGPVYETGHDCG